MKTSCFERSALAEGSTTQRSWNWSSSATGRGNGSCEQGVRAPGLGGTVGVIAAAASGCEGGRVVLGAGEVATRAPQEVRPATAVSPMNATVLRQMGYMGSTTLFLDERFMIRRNRSTRPGQAVHQGQVGRGLAHAAGEVAVGLTGIRLVAARSAAPHHTGVGDLRLSGRGSRPVQVLLIGLPAPVAHLRIRVGTRPSLVDGVHPGRGP